jgi:DNA-binding NarL/FixJ family response regulator
VKPLVVHPGHVAGLAAVLAELARSRWSLHAGWNPPRHGFRVVDAAIVCHGAVVDEEDAASAVLAAARGAGVVAAVGPAPGLAAILFQDLSRLGQVTTPALTGTAKTLLDPQSHALLQALAEGTTLAAAARSLSISRRTADRRLAAARRRLDVTTTAEALARLAAAGT